MTARSWPALDGLRGVAILCVIVAHSQVIKAPVAGMIGVTLFFVLSGFLITFLLLDEEKVAGAIDLKAFYGRRAIRLLPALGIYLAGIAVLMSILDLGLPIWGMTWPPALYVANYAQIAGHDIWVHRHLWSLAVEEHFYLLWPVLVMLGAAKRTRALVLVLAGLVLWRLAVGSIDQMWAYHSTDTNAYALGVGCLLAIAYHRGWRIPLHLRTAEAGVMTLILLCLVPASDLGDLYSIGVWLPPIAALVSAVTVLAVVQIGPTFLTGSKIRWFGTISYSLYLWHAPLLQIPFLASSPLTRLLAVTLAIGIAWLSWHLIEGPILRSRWRQRLIRGQRAPLVAVEGT
jgi:peptidoglycan/LPS O-acetylase OafA/YrhL